jgi:CheY-like chemotaxis protein/HD-like signal output (HDOD) protein
MGNVLVIDDTAFWREVVSNSLRLDHHQVTVAVNGAEALTHLRQQKPDLIVLDVDMPEIQGLTLLEKLRHDDRWRDLPVIMLTGDAQKEHVLLAGKLGVVGYLLKSRFSPQELLERVRQQVQAPRSGTVDNTKAPAPQPAPAVTKSPSGSKPATATIKDAPRLLTHDVCMQRVGLALSGITLAGVVAEVIALSASPQVNLADLVKLIGRDGILSAHILQAANCASKTSARGAIANLSDAVRVVGCSGVRNIAASVGVFTAMPVAEADGFDPIHCWQHSLGVAMICEQLSPPPTKGLAYLIGLCHDLGEILFRSHFGPEYRQVLQLHIETRLSLHDLELQMLGTSQTDICKEIFTRLGLPDDIRRPIERYRQTIAANSVPTDPLARILRLADGYAVGCLLASSTEAPLRCFTKTEWRNCFGPTDPHPLDAAKLHHEVLALTKIMARLPAVDQAAAERPLAGKTQTRVWVIREPALCEFDPIETALKAIAHVTSATSLPSEQEMGEHQVVLVLTRLANVPGFMLCDVEALATKSDSSGCRVVLLTSKKDPSLNSENVTIAEWPISISELAQILKV